MKRRPRLALLWLGVACAIGSGASGFAQGGGSGKARPGPKGQAEATPARQEAAGEGPSTTEESRVLYSAAPDDKSLFDFDYGPPTSPASQLLGPDAGAAPPSTSLTSFVLSIPNVVGGEQGQGIALDFAPAALFERRGEASYNRYVSDSGYLYRLGHRTRLTAAVINGTDGGNDPGKAVRSGVAFGLSASLLDSSDPLVTRDSEGRRILQQCLSELTPAVMPILQETADYDVDDLSRKQIERDRFVQALQILNTTNDPVAAREKIKAYLAPGAQRAGPGNQPGSGVQTPPTSPGDLPSPDEIAQIRADLANVQFAPAQRAVLERILDLTSRQATRIGELEGRAVRDGPRAAAGGSTPRGGSSPTSQPTASISDAELKPFVEQRITRLTAEIAPLEAAQARPTTTRLTDEGWIARINRCSELASRTARFSADLDVGVGLVARGRPGEIADLEMRGGAVWAAFRFPLNRIMFRQQTVRETPDQLPTSALMLVASGRYGWNERLATGNATTPEFQANTIGAWVGLEYLEPNFRLTGQYGWRRTYAQTASGEPFETSGDRFLIQGQVQLGNERSPLWLDVSYGQATGTTDALSDETIMVTLRYTPPKPPNLSR
jgi:hypothetical protein